jgi:lysophospholipase L1-like esterase
LAIRVALCLASLLVTFLVAELGLRLFWNDYYVAGPRGNVVFHPTRGWANAPNATVDFGKPEFHFIAHHNSLGFRGPEIGPKQPGRIRVLALGDSMTYGLGVNDDETFEAQLEALDPRFEVLNSGVPGYSTVEELLLLREVGLDLDPDLVLLMFLPNDLEGALKESYTRVTLENGVLHFDTPTEPQLDHPALRAKQTRHPQLSRSYVYRFVSDRLKILRYLAREEIGLPVSDGSALRPEEREPAWQLVGALLHEVDRLTRAHGAKFLLVGIPEPRVVEPEMRVVGIDPESFNVQEKLHKLADREGIPMFDLLPGLSAEHVRSGRPLHYHFDGHWNPVGHRVAADLIAPEIARAIGSAPSEPK